MPSQPSRADRTGTPSAAPGDGANTVGPVPIDDVLAQLAVLRGRRIHLVPLDFTDLQLGGARVHGREGDAIFYDERADAAGRDRIIRGQLDALLRDPVDSSIDALPDIREVIVRAITEPPHVVLAQLVERAVVEDNSSAGRRNATVLRLPAQAARAS